MKVSKNIKDTASFQQSEYECGRAEGHGRDGPNSAAMNASHLGGGKC